MRSDELIFAFLNYRLTVSPVKTKINQTTVQINYYFPFIFETYTVELWVKHVV